MLDQRVRRAIMACDQDCLGIHALILGEGSRQPCLSTMFLDKVGVEEGAITESVFQHAVDSGAAGAGKVKKA
jgi:hypothetical protein